MSNFTHGGYGLQLGTWLSGVYDNVGGRDMFHACCSNYGYTWAGRG